MSPSVKRYILIISIFVLTFGCQTENNSEPDLMQVKSNEGEDSKKIILLLVDSMMTQAIEQGLQQEVLPTLKFLIDHGQYYKHLVSSFPTMSVTIDSSLLTGTYPNDHHVPGLIWYSAEDKKIVNYGTGPIEIFRNGLDSTFMDALTNLNSKHLSSKFTTIYEELTRKGLKSGSINGLIYRGDIEHTLNVPALLKGATSLPDQLMVKGPEFLALGSLTNPLDQLKDLPDGVTQRMGFNDQYSLEVTRYLIETNNLPDFLLVYLSDMDQKMHENGPPELDGLQEVDQQLDKVLQAFGSPEKALEKATFILIGDSGMTQIVSEEDKPNIHLPALFKNDKVLRPGEAVTDDIEMNLAVNQTMAYVYKLNSDKSLKDMAQVMTSDKRIDFVAWKEKEWICVMQGETGKEFRYKPKGWLRDPYGQNWTIEQHEEVLDINIDSNKQQLDYGQYPDVLQRLFGALHSHAGEYLVVTAKPGYELVDRSSPTHEGGGGHGSLHKEESLVPLIISGTDHKPEYLRIVDLKSYIVNLLTTSKAG